MATFYICKKEDDKWLGLNKSATKFIEDRQKWREWTTYIGASRFRYEDTGLRLKTIKPLFKGAEVKSWIDFIPHPDELLR